MREATRAKWAERVGSFRASGLTLAEFSRKTGINVHSLKWWAWRLKGDAADRASSRSAIVRKGPSASIGPLTFIELKALPRSAPALELVHRSKHKIRIREGFDSATLARVLDVLDARP